MSLRASVCLDRPGFSLDLPLTVEAGQVVALLGPNGAGKSTALAVLAGLIEHRGRVELDDADLDRLPPERRPVGMVFQDLLLFPHLSNVDNVAFGLRARGVARDAARRTAAGWLGRLGLAALSTKRPGALSGGQAQLVALARALAVEPRLLLLDEPLSALDASTRLDVRAVLHRHLAGFAGCTVLVSHDPIDALVLADHIVVLEAGRVVQAGTPQEVARRPRTEYVARLTGYNLYRGRAEGERVRLAGGATVAVRPVAAGEVHVAFRPSAVALHRHRPEGSPRNVWQLRVGGMEPHGDAVRVALAGELAVLADITPAAVRDLGVERGAPIWASVKANEVDVYPT
ncbi:MAG: ABC transporter ATP-binding protein [Actinomycetota bacterium]|nr:ABC transporter ATP-binding protein [Actinomycetota bacterium]